MGVGTVANVARRFQDNSEPRPHSYEVGENQFLLVQDEELQAARQEARTWPQEAVVELLDCLHRGSDYALEKPAGVS
jgi:hypothetical protein